MVVISAIMINYSSESKEKWIHLIKYLVIFSVREKCQFKLEIDIYNFLRKILKMLILRLVSITLMKHYLILMNRI